MPKLPGIMKAQEAKLHTTRLAKPVVKTK